MVGETRRQRCEASGIHPLHGLEDRPGRTLAQRSMPLVADRELVFLGVHLGDPLRPLEKPRAV